MLTVTYNVDFMHNTANICERQTPGRASDHRSVPATKAGIVQRMDLRIEVSGLNTVTIVSPTSVEFDALVTSLLGRLAERALRLKPYLAVCATNHHAR